MVTGDKMVYGLPWLDKMVYVDKTDIVAIKWSTVDKSLRAAFTLMKRPLALIKRPLGSIKWSTGDKRSTVQPATMEVVVTEMAVHLMKMR